MQHSYREYAAAPTLRPYVECYWRATSEGAPGFRNREPLVPDLRIELIFNAGVAWHWFPSGATGKEPSAALTCIGMRGSALAIQQPGRLDHFAVRFRPGGLTAFATVPLGDLTQRCWDMRELWSASAVSQLAECLASAGDDASRVEVANTFLLRMLLRSRRDAQLARRAAGMLAVSYGQLPIEQLARQLGVDYKRLERAFVRDVGLSQALRPGRPPPTRTGALERQATATAGATRLGERLRRSSALQPRFQPLGRRIAERVHGFALRRIRDHGGERLAWHSRRRAEPVENVQATPQRTEYVTGMTTHPEQPTPRLVAIAPHLTIAGANEALAFYERAFGARRGYVQSAPDGRVLHADMELPNGGVFFLADDFPEHGGSRAPGAAPSPVTIHLELKDVDAVWQEATKAGATVEMPLADQFWGARYGILRDPFGHRWSLAQQMKQPTRAELDRAAKSFG